MAATSGPNSGQLAFQGLTTLIRAIERLHATGEVRRRSGITLERALHPVIFVIGDRGVARIGDLALDLGLEPSTVSRHVSRLVERGLVDRATDDSDRRASAVKLTRDGVSTRDALADAWRGMLGDAEQIGECDDREFGAGFIAVATGLASLVSSPAVHEPAATD